MSLKDILIKEVTIEDIQMLINNNVDETNFVEYKREINLTNFENKKEPATFIF